MVIVQKVRKKKKGQNIRVSNSKAAKLTKVSKF